ncbi:ATP-dependent zinc metalloprotease FtsH [Parvicella tangerina]|uniref:ATP-dependent zinc metalloprotease FtsH n=1 Tax=Parvicella tangerina TaxID=2829795 RepID=A0A916JPK9_9FLAO|nr:ATP-dependent zinc metalloprotease FtsH [Parvicella tangerina]CAG5086396.1 ATP-dependent zinc metalloprotease FtsH [Parvicella tangerina]
MANNKPKRPNPMGGNKGGKKPSFNFYWIYAVIAVILIAFTLIDWEGSSKKISQPEFEANILDSNYVDHILIKDKSVVEVYLNEEGLKSHYYKENKSKNDGSLLGGAQTGPQFFFKIISPETFGETIKEWETAHPGFDYDVDETNTLGRDILGWIIPIGLMIVIWIIIMRRITGGAGGAGSQIFSIGKSRAQVFGNGKSTNVSFKDVAGLEGAKEEIQEIVDFLKHPKKYTELGAKIPKGALLVGPPGTGKTLLAKAVAGEAKVPFFSLSGSDFVEMFVGVGASRVRDLFKQAKEKSPSIIFIDEIDAIGKARGRNAQMSSNDEHENTLNQLLTEMDGFGTNSGVIILAATNRADVLDKALLRAGRFDRQIMVDMPDLNERKAIFNVHLKPIKVTADLDREFLAKQTPGFSGADIANICNEAALIAARKKKKMVEMQDFLDAVDRIVGGLEKKNKIITPEEKRTIAFHEAGHATVSWMCEYANPLVKVTIVPRGRSLGAAWYLPEERQITTTQQILDEMCAAMGGRAAEKLIFGRISTGALSDLDKVTKQATAMVTIYGLNEKIGNVSYYDPQNQYGFTKPYSEETARLIDEEVKNMIEEQYKRAIKILSENKDKLVELAEMLLKKEVIFKDDLEKVFGKRPFDHVIPDPEEVKKEDANSNDDPIIPTDTDNSEEDID